MNNALKERDRWKIRFAQIFQILLSKEGQKVEDFLYFIPTGAMPDPPPENAFDILDLKQNKTLYTQLFTGDIPPVKPLGKNTADLLDSTVVIVPGIGHHLIEHRAFEEQIPILESLGFRVIYAWYDDSFESDANCAKKVYDIIKAELDNIQSIIFFTYSKGSPILVELLTHEDYADIIARTKAVVSFAGALGGTYLASSPKARLALKLLKAYRRIHRQPGFFIKLFRKLATWISRLPFPRLQKAWQEVRKKAEELADDLLDLPDGIIDLKRITSRDHYADACIPETVKLFSISAVYPLSAFQQGLQFITNADDLFLYVSSLEMHQYSLLNDTQVTLADSVFYEGIGDITELGVVRTDHWGIALSRVFSRSHSDPFPRTAMLQAVLLLLDEYFNPLD